MSGSPSVEAAAREIVSLARSGASRARLRARLRALAVAERHGTLKLAPDSAALLASQIPLWIGRAGTVERTSRAISAFLERRG